MLVSVFKINLKYLITNKPDEQEDIYYANF